MMKSNNDFHWTAIWKNSIEGIRISPVVGWGYGKDIIYGMANPWLSIRGTGKRSSPDCGLTAIISFLTFCFIREL
jgi:hypothetical protein